MKSTHQPIRSCVGCGQKQAPKAMLRVASHDGGAPLVDVEQSAIGRGAYVCFRVKCVEKAITRKAFERSLKLKCGLSHNARDEITRAIADKLSQHRVLDV